MQLPKAEREARLDSASGYDMLAIHEQLRHLSQGYSQEESRYAQPQRSVQRNRDPSLAVPVS
jgi:hypothetical protein